MIIQDDRTPAELLTHRTLIVGTDRFMSGWGLAKSGSSVAAWACKSEDESKVLAYVESRSEMKRVRVAYESARRRYRPRSAAHFHIYVWSDR